MKSSEDLRLELTVKSTLDHTSEQSKKINGKDKMALQEEFLEWFSEEVEDIELLYMDHHQYW
jgi:uncharacterized membrane protein YvbJ